MLTGKFLDESGFYLALTSQSQTLSASTGSGSWVGKRSQPLLSAAFSCDSLYIAAISCMCAQRGHLCLFSLH